MDTNKTAGFFIKILLYCSLQFKYAGLHTYLIAYVKGCQYNVVTGISVMRQICLYMYTHSYTEQTCMLTTKLPTYVQLITSILAWLMANTNMVAKLIISLFTCLLGRQKPYMTVSCSYVYGRVDPSHVAKIPKFLVHRVVYS